MYIKRPAASYDIVNVSKNEAQHGFSQVRMRNNELTLS